MEPTSDDRDALQRRAHLDERVEAATARAREQERALALTLDAALANTTEDPSELAAGIAELLPRRIDGVVNRLAQIPDSVRLAQKATPPVGLPGLLRQEAESLRLLADTVDNLARMVALRGVAAKG
jgi:hypothetical protein